MHLGTRKNLEEDLRKCQATEAATGELLGSAESWKHCEKIRRPQNQEMIIKRSRDKSKDEMPHPWRQSRSGWKWL